MIHNSEIREKINSLVGCDEVKKELEIQLRRAEADDIDMPQNWIIMGNPGTGKTTVAMLIGEVYKACGMLSSGVVHSVSRADLIGCYIGQTAEKTRKCVERAVGGVLFVDEAYTLMNHDCSTGCFEQEAMDTLCMLMDKYRGQLVVIFAGYEREMIKFKEFNPAFWHRMNTIILKDYTKEQLVQIFELICKENDVLLEDALLEKIESFFENKKFAESNLYAWANAREAIILFREMNYRWNANQVYDMDLHGNKRKKFTSKHLPIGEEKKNIKLEIEPFFDEYVDFDTFSKSDFRVVKVKECSAVKKSKKLLHFVLDDGTGTDRIILSGIHAFYEPEELVGKTLVAITNLPPRKMMGIDSCGMLLSAVHQVNGEEKLNLIMVSDEIPAGAKLY